MRAAPLPLPSSDRRKDTLHFGDSSFTVWCMILEKLKRQEKRRVGRGRWEETLDPNNKEVTQDVRGLFRMVGRKGDLKPIPLPRFSAENPETSYSVWLIRAGHE